MLLIGDHGRLVSVRPEQAGTAFVLETRYRQAEQAREFLGRFERDEVWFRNALIEEVGRDCTAALTGLGDNDLIDAAAVGIATGAIRLAFPMPSTWRCAFDPRRPLAARIDAAWFPDRASTAHAVGVLLGERRAAAALEQALHSPAAERGLLTMAPRVARALLGQPVPEPPTWPPEFGLSRVELAGLLRDHWLLLLPRGTGGPAFQLAWAIHGGGASDTTDDGEDEPAAPRPRIRPETQDGPRSTLPTPPTTLSSQAEALIAAAVAGTPFCEECAAGAGAV